MPEPTGAGARPGRSTGREEPVEVRALRESDLPGVVAIEEASFTTPWSRRTFSNLLGRPNARLLAAVRGDELLGYAALWFAGGAAELGDLAVRDGMRRQGVGSRLLRAAIEEAARREAGEMFLEVRAGNRGAQALYRRHGFEVVGRRPRYYVKPAEDALVMRRTIRNGPSASLRPR